MKLSNEYVLDVFLKIQEVISPDISIEVGAFNAEFSSKMVKFGIGTYAFEASPYVYNRFKDDLKKITYINKAVSDKTGSIKFELIPGVDPSDTGQNTIKNRNSVLDYTYIDVESVSINEYFKDFDFKKGALWIDAEGASEEVLLGASGKLNKFSSIYMELEGEEFWKGCWQKDQVVDYLNSHGFELLLEVPCYQNQFDVIFINKDYKEELKGIVEYLDKGSEYSMEGNK